MTGTIPLNAVKRDGLGAALNDEYKSYETYQQVIRDFGAVCPLSNIVEAEARHVVGVQSKIDNVAFYDRLVERTQRLDILDVFRLLRSALQDWRPLAFQRYAVRGISGNGGYRV